MALNSDEKELVDKISEEVEDFYAPLMALVLYRYDKRTTPFGLPTEEVVKIVAGAYNDLQETS